LWIAVAWLGTGLYIGPALSGHEPRFQRLGVNFLFACLLIIVVGSFAGQWLAVMQKLGLQYNFWFGHQGWEYADMGRFWQYFLFVGLLLWLTLVGRALWPILRGPATDSKSIVALLFLSTVCIGLFFGAALMWGEHTHISEVEYWRWWLVHLWVEGFFEVFATAVMALIFTRLGLIRTATANVTVLFATIIFMAGGVLAPCTTCTSSGRPSRSSRWAQVSARSKWCRWPTSASRHTTPGSWDRRRRGWRGIAGRCCSSSRCRSGTWSVRACSAS
jgi:nitric oxide reductase subunit B